jgi:hypothetical protein
MKGIDKMIKAENIHNEEDVKIILDLIKPYNKYLDTIDEYSVEYEDMCFNIQEQFGEIFEALNIGEMKITNKNMMLSDLMCMRTWDYLKGKISFKNLIKELKKDYSKREI